MECRSSDSKKCFQIFDASKRTRKRREGIDDSHSIATDDSNCASQANLGRVTSGRSSMHELATPVKVDGNGDSAARRSNTSIHRRREEQRSPRRHRRSTRDGSLSLALKEAMASSPRSASPLPDGDATSPARDHDSLIYTFLEQAIKRDKKRRHTRRREERGSRDREHSEQREHRHREHSEQREHRHRHRRRRDHEPSADRDKHRKESPDVAPAVDQKALLETFAKLCAQINENTTKCAKDEVKCTHSHKSLQCESSRRELYGHQPEPPRPSEPARPGEPPRVRSHENCRHNHDHRHAHDNSPERIYHERPSYTSRIELDKEQKHTKTDYNKEQYVSSKIDVTRSRMHHDYRNYPPDKVATRTRLDPCRDGPRESDYCVYDRRPYEEDRRRYCEQKTSRSFELRNYDEERCRRTVRSDKDKPYYDRSFTEAQERHYKEHRSNRPSDRFDRNSIASKDDFVDRDRFSERERDSGLSVADGENSTISCRSNYLKSVKQEIAEQREAMDKMMKLWKELMRCFKGISQSQLKDKSINESACEDVRSSAAAQLRLWRECMRRYETVARDVGDTDSRLMEEINKQRGEMCEMATMWQECLARYKHMSEDLNTLKQRLVSRESPSRAAAEGEGPPYSLPHTYPIPGSLNPSMYGMCAAGGAGPGAGGVGPGAGGPGPGAGGAGPGADVSGPPWWWGPSPRGRSRRSSPDMRDYDPRGAHHRHSDRNTRHHRDTDDSRCKDKSSCKPSAARSEHRRRKR